MKDQERRENGLYKIYAEIPFELFLKMKNEIGFGKDFNNFVSEAIAEKFESLEGNYVKKFYKN